MASLNAKSILEQVRVNADQRDDFIPGVGGDDEGQRYLKDSELLAILNVAYNHLYSEIALWNEDYFLKEEPAVESETTPGTIQIPSNMLRLRMIKPTNNDRYLALKPISLRQSARYKEVNAAGQRLYYIPEPKPLKLDPAEDEQPPTNFPLGSDDYLIYFVSAQASEIELDQQKWANYALMKLESIRNIVRNRSTTPKHLTSISELYDDECYDYYDYPYYYVLFSDYIRFYSGGSYRGFF